MIPAAKAEKLSWSWSSALVAPGNSGSPETRAPRRRRGRRGDFSAMKWGLASLLTARRGKRAVLAFDLPMHERLAMLFSRLDALGQVSSI